MVKKYKLIDHTADFGIHVFGCGPHDLFTNAAYALFDMLTDIKALKGQHKKRISISAKDWPALMVNWLRELLSLWNGNDLLVKKTNILSLSENKLSAIIYYDHYDSARHDIKLEIKAVTYHQIMVSSGTSGWKAGVIFDV